MRLYWASNDLGDNKHNCDCSPYRFVGMTIRDYNVLYMYMSRA